MKTMHRFRKKALAITTIAACSLFYTTSCQKYEEPTAQQLEDAELIDYAVQVIPDIHDWAKDKDNKFDATDLVEAMNSLNALHFGDNPPSLVFERDGSPVGFKSDEFVVKTYIPSDPDCIYSNGDPNIPNSQPSMYVGRIYPWSYYFLFYDQHRGVGKCDFKSSFRENGPDDYVFEIAHIKDNVFIMGDDDYFTAYYFQARTKECSPNYPKTFTFPYDAVILSGKVTDDGIEDLYYGTKVIRYNEPDPIVIGKSIPSANDIIISYKQFVPWEQWDPNH